jgi:hypothetical protein
VGPFSNFRSRIFCDTSLVSQLFFNNHHPHPQCTSPTHRYHPIACPSQDRTTTRHADDPLHNPHYAQRLPPLTTMWQRHAPNPNELERPRRPGFRHDQVSKKNPPRPTLLPHSAHLGATSLSVTWQPNGRLGTRARRQQWGMRVNPPTTRDSHINHCHHHEPAVRPRWTTTM